MFVTPIAVYCEETFSDAEHFIKRLLTCLRRAGPQEHVRKSVYLRKVHLTG